MTIKAIKEAYADYRKEYGKTMYKVYDFGGEYGKCVIICKSGTGRDMKTVDQVVRVSDGKELLCDHRWRWTDNLEDAVDVAGEMLDDNDEYIEAEKEEEKKKAKKAIYKAAEGDYAFGMNWRDEGTLSEVLKLVMKYNAKYANDDPDNREYIIVGESVGSDGYVNGFTIDDETYLYRY